MKRNTMTKQQLLLEMEELRTRLDAAEQRLKGANEVLQAQIAERKRVEEALEKTQQYAQSIVETIREPLVVLTADLKVISANHSFYQTFKVTPEETEGRFIYSVGNHQWDIPVLRKLLEEIVPQNTHFNDFRVDHEFPTIGQKTMLLNARRIYREGKGTEMILLAIEDIPERKQTEEALKVSETRYRRLFETAQDGILILDADTGQISDVNPFLLKMLGYSREDVLGKKLWEIGAFRDIQASKAAFSELQTKGYVRYGDLPLETRDGRLMDVEFVSNVYLVDHKNVIQCNIRDITERKRAGDELRQKTYELGERVKELNCLYAYSKLVERLDICLPEVFQGLVDIIPAGWQYPEITCVRLALEHQVFKTSNFIETVWKQSSPIFVEGRHIGNLEVGYLEGKREFEEGPFLKSERNLIDALASRLGKTIERIRAQEAFRESEERYRRAIDATHDGIWEWDIQTGREFFSPRWCEIVGYSLNDPELPHTYNSWSSRIHPDDYDRVISALNNHLEKGTTYDVDYRHRHKSGEYRWQNSRGQAVFDEGGMPTKMVGCISDITERKWVEEALQKSRDELEQRVKERTAQMKRANEQLIQEMEEHKQVEEEKNRQHRRLEGLWKITRNIDADYKTLYDMVLVEIIEMTQSRYGFYGFINEDESVMTIHSWSKEAMEECKISDKPIGFPIAKAGLWGEAVRKRKILIVNDYKGDHPGKKGIPKGHVSLTRILTVPVFSHGRIIALATIGDKLTDYTEEDAEQIKTFMTHLQVILERRQAQEALEESENRLRLLSSQLLAVEEAERKRVARELHDGIGQTLTAIKFKIEDTLLEKGRSKGGLEKTSLVTLNEMVKKSIEEVRKIQMDLRPSTLDDLGILATISWFTREFVKIYSSLRIKKRIDLQEDEVPDSLKTIIFRVIQESLNNTAKHSKADWVSLSLLKTDGGMELRIEDNGIGFDLESTLSLKSVKRGYGLSSMRERAELSGGTFTIETIPGKGTIIKANWPI